MFVVAELDPDTLAADTRLTTIRLVNYLREIGCKIKSKSATPGVAAAGSKKYHCMLMAPLVFPETRRRGRGPPS